MALHESNHVSISGNDCTMGSGGSHTIQTTGLYQVVYGGVTSNNDGGYINIYLNHGFLPIDSLPVSKYTTSSDIAMKTLIYNFDENDRITISGDINTLCFYAYQQIK